MNVTFNVRKRPGALLIAGLLSATGVSAAEETEALADDEAMLVTAEQKLKQQPGVSTITAEDIKKARRLTISPTSSVKCPAST